MNKVLVDIEKAAFTLSDSERAMLAHHLIQTLDKDEDEDVEEIWLKEAEKRYEEYIKRKNQSQFQHRRPLKKQEINYYERCDFP